MDSLDLDYQQNKIQNNRVSPTIPPKFQQQQKKTPNLTSNPKPTPCPTPTPRRTALKSPGTTAASCRRAPAPRSSFWEVKAEELRWKTPAFFWNTSVGVLGDDDFLCFFPVLFFLWEMMNRKWCPSFLGGSVAAFGCFLRVKKKIG